MPIYFVITVIHERVFYSTNGELMTKVVCPLSLMRSPLKGNILAWWCDQASFSQDRVITFP